MKLLDSQNLHKKGYRFVAQMRTTADTSSQAMDHLGIQIRKDMYVEMSDRQTSNSVTWLWQV